MSGPLAPPLVTLGLWGLGAVGGGCCYPWLPRPPVLPGEAVQPLSLSLCKPSREAVVPRVPRVASLALLPPSPRCMWRCPGRWAVMGVIEAQPRSSGRGAEPAVPSSSVCPRSWMQFPGRGSPGADSPRLLPRMAPWRADGWVRTVGDSSRGCGHTFFWRQSRLEKEECRLAGRSLSPPLGSGPGPCLPSLWRQPGAGAPGPPAPCFCVCGGAVCPRPGRGLLAHDQVRPPRPGFVPRPLTSCLPF